MINITGLSVGIACGTLILLFVRHERTADRFHEHLDEIYRVYRVENRVNGDTKISAGVSAPLGSALATDLPNVETTVRMRTGIDQVDLANRTYAQPVLYADPDFLSVFTVPFVGPPSGAPLVDRYSLVLSTDAAQKYFGDVDPVGKTLTIRTRDAAEDYTVTAVASPFPNNSSITFEVLLPIEAWPEFDARSATWEAFNVAVYLRLSPGARRWQLAFQFWGEAILTSLISLIVGLVLAQLALPLFNALASTNIGAQNVDATFVLQLVAMALTTGLVAGGYPALILSGFRPVRVLKGDRSVGRGLSFSRVMVVAQFAISIGMITSTLILYDQVDFLKSKDLGFDDEEIVSVDLQADQTDEDLVFDRFKNDLGRRPDVVSVTSASYALADGWSRISMRQGEKQTIVYLTRVDPDYLRTMGLHVVAGRRFTADRESDRRDVLINEELASELLYENPVGELLPGYEEAGVRILGVVADFNYRSLRDRIEPLILHMSPALTPIRYALIRVRTDHVAQALAGIGESWNAVAPGQPFDHEFMDQRLDALYGAEERWGWIVRAAALLAILIACLGLFGLATLTAGRRTKEIGIRKILGASVPGVVGLLSREFLVLIAIAFVVSAPLVWIVMQQWLDGFAYRITLGPGVFIQAGLLVTVVAAATVSWQTVRVATADPARSLRYE